MPSDHDPKLPKEWREQRQQWQDYQRQILEQNEDNRPFYKPGVPFRTVVSLAFICAFLIMSIIIVWFSVFAGVLLFICAGITLAVELATGGR